jgi:hypothetical protein
VILFVTGHVHHNRVTPHFRRGGSGFWQVTTASHLSYPQQTRLIELMDNRDGTLSIFGTMLDTAAPNRRARLRHASRRGERYPARLDLPAARRQRARRRKAHRRDRECGPPPGRQRGARRSGYPPGRRRSR